ncbi:amidohydrolase family protein [Polyangium sp. 15x6]|uniref:amidohydrolase n=1 Tax=Polyangium sp. 15x6 TaxID=3042687 RepID=UPI00249C1383|nr:amidohydrolase family protein [Polyangium sp. 15x6]MDI3285858.1 amidohydrolase family protein [Polyangium sp. 15x6]
MSANLILKASTIITMDPAKPRAEAVAFDTATGVITAVGSFDEVQKLAPDAKVQDLGALVLMPGFIDPHSHPLNGGMVTQPPAYWISPYIKDEKTGTYPYSTFDQVKAFWAKLDSQLPNGQAVVCNGLDRLLQGAPELTNKDLDACFPSGRPVVILDNSGHEVYFNSTVIKGNPTVFPNGIPVEDPPGARYGRYTKDDVAKDPTLTVGASNGRAYETAAVLNAVGYVLHATIPDPLHSAALWYQLMAKNGITMTSEHTYQTEMLPYYLALSSVPDSPLRLGLYHMSIEADCGEKVPVPNLESRLWKQGIKLWADGSPWVGNIAASFPYLDNEKVRAAGIPLGPGGTDNLNYTRVELDQILDKYTPLGWQFAFHCNGDIALDVVLDAYQRALANHGLLGTDHRWRVEHCGGCRGDQFARAADLGVMVSLPPFQFIYWGDLLDGTMFTPEIGRQWVRAGDAMKTRAPVSFHNDGCVSPPKPLLNIQSMVTRRTPSGTLHGPEQAVSLHDALMAHTMHAAHHLRRDHDLGSITVGKLADFVELTNDPYVVDIEKLANEVAVNGTWSNGKRVDLAAFLDQIAKYPAIEAKPRARAAAFKRCC